MALTPGARLGPYEIVAPLGAGGMGEVYKARDTRLDRIVAIKILPDTLAADPEFRERFDREAKTISQLSHPHICTLFDVGDGYLVLELLDGETLADRLAKGALPPAQAMTIAIEVASALDTAHRAGIVHRDLKPGNVMLTKAGAKLLDFGLAKINAAVVAVSGTMVPTTPPNITAQGTILGTFQYMAPEQIEGIDADARTDIFAFGCVLFEMLTGQKAFAGKTRASLIGAILKDEPPPVSQVQSVAPAALNRIVATCLAKDPDDRWQSARDLMRELKWVAEGGEVSGPPSSDARPPTKPGVLQIAGIASLVLAAAAIAWTLMRPAAPVPGPAVRVSIDLGAEGSLWSNNSGASAIESPDGTLLAFVAQKGPTGRPQLYLRRLDHLEAVLMSGTDGASSAFFSPDGQWIAFFADSKLKKVSVTGGAAVTLCDVPAGRGGSWGDDGVIVYSPANSPGTALMRVSSAGGKPEPLTTLAPGEVTHRFPHVLPGARAVLYMAHTTTGSYEDAIIIVQPLPTGPRKVLVRGGYYPQYARSGHLTYIHQGTLFAAPFDLKTLEVTGQAVPVAEGIASGPGGGAQVAVSASGTLTYLPGASLSNAEPPMQWLDRAGKATILRATASNWADVLFSPDGRRVAFDVFDTQSDVWTYDWERDITSRLTFDASDDEKPVWTPDGRRIAFASKRADKATFNLYWQNADGTGDVQRLTESKNQQRPASWHPSGKYLAFYELRPDTNYDVMILPMEGDERAGWKPGKPTVFVHSPFAEYEPMFSPDGRWLAYVSTENGHSEVFVRPFPGPGGRWQVSVDGGALPTWSRTGRELFYLGGNGQLMATSYAVDGDSFRPEKPRLLNGARIRNRPRGAPTRVFDLHPDGTRFAVSVLENDLTESRQDRLVMVFNFFDELRRAAAPKK